MLSAYTQLRITANHSESQRITKAEALIRWQHPEKGLISPAEFIPLAEESGLIIAIGQKVFEQVCRDIPTLKQAYGESLQVSINVSPIQFAHEKTQLTGFTVSMLNICYVVILLSRSQRESCWTPIVRPSKN
ncbi:EAL domain-containing protein [Nitrincola iocasae]|uniref:EAL domain-containing protein n=1 Tax=Nitrincola iocasae TaxID=2614693 RepID=A0A5J6LL61_9GAMM|nr:EAL domain-containing protein [Nitrincola iocasae]